MGCGLLIWKAETFLMVPPSLSGNEPPAKTMCDLPRISLMISSASHQGESVRSGTLSSRKTHDALQSCSRSALPPMRNTNPAVDHVGMVAGWWGSARGVAILPAVE